MWKNDTMAAYVADRAPQLAPFPYFPRRADRTAA